MVISDSKALVACVGGSIITYNAIRILSELYASRKQEWVAVGRVKHLWIYPIKSCHRREVFSLRCGPLGVSFNELRDREFLIIDEDSKKMHTARTVPLLCTIQADVNDGVLTVSIPNGRSVKIVLKDVMKARNVVRATLHAKLESEGLDCGDEVAQLLSEYCETAGMRLIFYRPGLFNGRPCITEQSWWDNPVPKRKDTVMYADLAPYMITTEGSLDALNEQLDTPVSSSNFRENIVVDSCVAWDEDKWAEFRIGETILQCFKPCTRCILTTVDPETGVKDPGMQPLKKLREFRLAPEGKLRDEFKDSPIFGVNAGLSKPGEIHLGQTVYVKYKPSAF